MRKCRRLITGIFVSLIVMSGLVMFIPMNATAGPNPIPALTVSLEPSSQTAVVSESAQGSVQFTGTIRIDKLPVERIVVTLTASVDTGWAAQCTPSSMVFTSTQPQSFSATVVVPPACDSTIIGTLKVDAIATGGGFRVPATAQAIVTVKPYFRLMLESDNPYREIWPGSQTMFTFKLWNMGNAIDSYDIEITNLKDLADRGWTVTLSSTSVSKIPQNQYKNVKISAQSPRFWTLYKSEPTVIMIKAKSQNAEAENLVVQQSFALYVYEKGWYIPGFDPMLLIIGLVVAIVIYKRKELQ